MRALQVVSANDLRLVTNLPSLPLQAGQLRVAVQRVGVCGTDLSLIAGKLPFARYPIVPGHEFSAIVTEVTPGSSFSPGDRVTANPILSCRSCAACQQGDIHHCKRTEVMGVVSRSGAMAEELILDEDMTWRLPEELSLDLAALVEPVAVALRVANRTGVGPGCRLALFGSGAVGLLLLLVARARQARFILVTDLVQPRLRLASQLGANQVANAGESDWAELVQKENSSFDIVVDGVGTSATLRDAIALARRGGTVVVYGVPSELLASGQIRPEPLLSQPIPLADAPAAIRRLISDPGWVAKLLISPQSGGGIS